MAISDILDVRIQQKHDTQANWESNNPILLDGEIGYETDTGNIKIGDGSTSWLILNGTKEHYADKEETEAVTHHIHISESNQGIYIGGATLDENMAFSLWGGKTNVPNNILIKGDNDYNNWVNNNSEQSIFIGYNGHQSGSSLRNCVVIGNELNIWEDNNFNINLGYYSDTTGDKNVCIGCSCSSRDNENILIGSNLDPVGGRNVLIGNTNWTSICEESVLIGNNIVCTQKGCIQLGTGTNNGYNGEALFQVWNKPLLTASGSLLIQDNLIDNSTTILTTSNNIFSIVPPIPTFSMNFYADNHFSIGMEDSLNFCLYLGDYETNIGKYSYGGCPYDQNQTWRQMISLGQSAKADNGFINTQFNTYGNIQIGLGINYGYSIDNITYSPSLQIYEYQLLDLDTGKIPSERLPENYSSRLVQITGANIGYSDEGTLIGNIAELIEQGFTTFYGIIQSIDWSDGPKHEHTPTIIPLNTWTTIKKIYWNNGNSIRYNIKIVSETGEIYGNYLDNFEDEGTDSISFLITAFNSEVYNAANALETE